MTIVKTLKALYERLGGTPSDVANATRAVDVLNAIAALYDGASNATRITKAIANIAAVASGLIKPSGVKVIESNGMGIDVKEYAYANVNVPEPSGTIGITSNGTFMVTKFAFAQVDISENKWLQMVGRTINTQFTVTGDLLQNFIIGKYAFAYCDGMPSIVFNGLNTANYNIVMDHAFLNCTNLTSLNLFGFREVQYCAFAYSGITEIFFSTDLINFYNNTDTGEGVFDNADNLTDIYYTGTQQQWEAITGLSGAGIPQGCTIHYEYTPS